MYELTCPYCFKDGIYWEVEGHFGRFVPYDCEHCKKTFWVFHRSFFDPTYDNFNVEIKTQQQIDEMVAQGKLVHRDS